MPFASLETIKPFVAKGVHEALSRTGSPFNDLEKSAAIVIRDMTGYAVPVSINDRPDWSDKISAWLIEYYAKSLMTGNSESETERINENYKQAFVEMRRYRKAEQDNDSSQSSAFADCGSFEGQEEW